MSKTNKLIRISGIMTGILGLMSIDVISWFQVMQLIICGLLLSYSELSELELRKKKTILIITAICSFVFNFVAGILLIIAVSDLSSNNKEINDNQEYVTDASRRIDILLKIGIGMVFVSGLLIATTSWETIPNIIKCICLLMIGGVFLGLSKFSEIRLNILKTTKAYYVLGLCLCWLSFVCVGVLGVFSKWFSYTGDGANLVWLTTTLLLSGLFFVINNKFNEREYKYRGLLTLWISLFFGLRFLGINISIIGLMITVILLLVNILMKNKQEISLVTRLVSLTYWPLLFNNGGIEVVVIVSLIIAIINTLYLMNEENTDNKIYAIIISYILGIELMTYVSIGDINILIFVFASIFYSLINRCKIRIIKNINQILYNIIASLIIFSLDSELKIFVISIIYGLVHAVNYFVINKDNNKFDKYYQPIVIFFVIYGIFTILSTIINIGVIYYFIIPAFIYILIEHYLVKNDKIQKIYYVYLLIVSCISGLINIIDCDIYGGILLIILASYIFLWKNMKNVWTYILLLLAIILFKNVVYEHFSYGIFLNFINIIIFGGLTYLFKDNSLLKRINLISIVIPVYFLIGYIEGINDIKIILNNILSLYIVFIIVTQFIKDEKTKDIIAAIFTGIILLGVIFNNSLLVGLYVGILGIGILLITYNNKEYKSLFYLGIVVTILNIIIKLGDFWTRIPISVYLLIAGIVLIGFVTMKELKGKDQKEDVKSNKTKENVSRDVKMNFCPRCGERNNNNKFCPKCGMMLVKK